MIFAGVICATLNLYLPGWTVSTAGTVVNVGFVGVQIIKVGVGIDARTEGAALKLITNVLAPFPSTDKGVSKVE